MIGCAHGSSEAPPAMAAKCPFSGDAEDASLFDDLSEDGPEFPLPEGIKKDRVEHKSALFGCKQIWGGPPCHVHSVFALGFATL